MSADPGAPAAAPARAEYSAAYRRTVAVLVMLAYTSNSADRTLIGIIGQPMKEDLGLTDTQLGLLGGLAFASLYAFSGLPVARLAERISRVRIITIATTCWSLLTACLGAAHGFVQLLLIRTGVGVFESGCTPPAHSLLSDYFGPSRRTTALSFYSCGISLGYIVSAVVGGYVALHFGWRAACVAVGLPGVAVAFAIGWIVREPPRGNADPAMPGGGARALAPGAGGIRSELREFREVARTLLFRRPIGHIVAGVTIATFAAQGSYLFVPAYFKRAFDLDYGTIGLVMALAGGVSVAIGLLAGGAVTDWLGARAPRWYAIAPALGLLACTPIYVAAFLQTDWAASAWLIGIAAFFQYVSFGPTFGIVQNVVGPHRRATATALIYILLNIIGLGLGTVFTGWLIDRFADFDLSHAEVTTALHAFAALLAGDPGSTASFRSTCYAAGSLVTGRPDCTSVLAIASRQGIIVTVLLYAWAAVHYFLGGIGLERELPLRTAHDGAAPEGGGTA